MMLANYSSQFSQNIHIMQWLKGSLSRQKVRKRARSLARIKASASGAENPGFKSQRARHPPNEFILHTNISLLFSNSLLAKFETVGRMNKKIFFCSTLVCECGTG